MSTLPFIASATIDGELFDDARIRNEELIRARHALEYLKGRIGNSLMRELMAGDIAATMACARGRIDASEGRWRTGVTELVVPGPAAAVFRQWYEQAMGKRREVVLRAGHPEHFVLNPGDGGIEVVENVGETDLPWHIFYRSLPEDAFPMKWDPAYPVRFGAEIVDGSGLRVGYTMHQSCDAADGMHLHLRTLLPEAAPRELVDRHLRHFAIEFTNWTHAAWLESQEASA
ncbi:hypothetical protein [Polymorphobacter megasporae]|uniref:hypothetical protein n=1 Tax=Glacieibacterium megasporae TaxID=2835787 RepID=UPI001C1DEC77|nr:hypothetical protein [Polymorphobacter megasporae]UAJ10563.1 hypothetical protein KTC28_02035 [Polymorphobacter megasporae]